MNAKSITKILCSVLIIFTINEHDDDDDDGFMALPPQSNRIPVNSVNFQSGFRVSTSKICLLFGFSFDLTSSEILLKCTAMLVILIILKSLFAVKLWWNMCVVTHCREMFVIYCLYNIMSVLVLSTCLQHQPSSKLVKV